MKPFQGGAAALAALLLAAGGARADLIVTNPSFETPDPNHPTTTLTGVDHWGYSAAAGWTTWNNTPATTFTELLPSTLPGGGERMIHVRTTGAGNGIVQVLAPHNTGPDSVVTSAHVFAVSGRVSLGTGNGGDTSPNVVSTGTGAWQVLRAPNGTSPANEVVVYSYGGPANFYVDLVSVEADPVHIASVPEPPALLPATWAALWAAAGCRRWRFLRRAAAAAAPGRAAEFSPGS
jgi:hypothetical protein